MTAQILDELWIVSPMSANEMRVSNDSSKIKKYDIVCSGTTAAKCFLMLEMRFRTPETARTRTNKTYKNSNFRKIMDLTCVSLIVSYSGETRGFATFRWVLVSGRPREQSGHPRLLVLSLFNPVGA